MENVKTIRTYLEQEIPAIYQTEEELKDFFDKVKFIAELRQNQVTLVLLDFSEFKANILSINNDWSITVFTENKCRQLEIDIRKLRDIK